MRISILGSRGIPGNYGGFETCAEQLSTRLVARGHKVTVYCMKSYSTTADGKWRGVRRIVLPSIRKKSIEKPFHAILSLLHVSFTDADVILMLGVSASNFCFVPRLFGKKVAINIDGLEWQRRKWGRIAAWYLKLSEKMAGISANRVVTDAKWIRQYYKETYGKDSVYIAYGADIIDYQPSETLNRLGLNRGEYILYVSRFDPENNPLLVKEAFEEIGAMDKKLVMVGDAPFADHYIRSVRETNNPNIIFTGYLYGNAYRELLSNAYLYIQATEIGGTHPALIEAMGAGNCVLANDVPEHREVLKDAGIYYSGKDDLRQKLLMLIKEAGVVKQKGAAASRIIDEEYSWDEVTLNYERMLMDLLR